MNVFNINTSYKGFQNTLKKQKQKTSETSLTAFEMIYLRWDDEDREDVVAPSPTTGEDSKISPLIERCLWNGVGFKSR